LSRSLSWRTFVLSNPLQIGMWLLRRLRPLSCTPAFSLPVRVKQFQSSPVPRGHVRATRSLPAIRRVYHGRTLTDVEAVRHIHRYRLVKCVSRFHLFEFTTLQTQVSLGSLGRRGSPCLRFGSEISVHCQWASHASGVPLLNACHFPLASFSRWAFSGYTFTR